MAVVDPTRILPGSYAPPVVRHYGWPGAGLDPAPSAPAPRPSVGESAPAVNLRRVTLPRRLRPLAERALLAAVAVLAGLGAVHILQALVNS